MKKTCVWILTLILTLTGFHVATAESYSFDAYEKFEVYYTFPFDLGGFSGEELYSTGYNRAVFAFQLLMNLSFDTGMSTGSSDYVIQWRGDMFVGRSRQYESELMLAAIVYNRIQKQPYIVFCRYNPENGQAYYALKEYDSSLIGYYMVYDMGNLCGEDNYEHIEVEDMNKVISEVEEQFGGPIFQ